MRAHRHALAAALLSLTLLLGSCLPNNGQPYPGPFGQPTFSLGFNAQPYVMAQPIRNQRPQVVAGYRPSIVSAAPRRVSTPASPAQLLREVGVQSRLVSPKALGRSQHPPMAPQYITIHATASSTMTAADFAASMARGMSSRPRTGASHGGKLSWHFTVDQTYAVQHLSTFVQGGHADFNGPGNHYSIGIEMCEYRGASLNAIMDRTAKLAAYLMWKHRIPLSHVVPHYHWARAGTKPVHKPCPHFLMDNGKPGAKWAAFQRRVQSHYQRLLPG